MPGDGARRRSAAAASLLQRADGRRTGGGHRSDPRISGSARLNRDHRAITIVAACAVAASLIARLASTFIRLYAQDDLFWAYTSWLRSQPQLIPNRDYLLTNFTPLAEIAAPLFRWFPESLTPFYIARTVIFIVGVLLVYTTYRLTRALDASVLWSLIAATALTWEFHFVKRIGDIRADQITALFLVLAVLYALRAQESRAAFLCGVMFGISVAVSYKIAIAGPMLLAGIILISAVARIRRSILFLAGGAIAPLAYFGWRIFVDGWPVFLDTLRGIFTAVVHGISERWGSWSSAFILAPAVFLAIAAGAVAMIADKTNPKRRAYAILTLAFLAIFVAANPYIFPYNFVIFMPLIAPLIAGIEPWLQRRTARFEQWVAALLIVSAIIGGFFAVYTTIVHDNEAQNRVMHWIWQGTEPSERVYDWQGMHVGRRGIFHWWHFTGWQPRYEHGWYSVADEVTRAQVTLLIKNYRFTLWTPEDAGFMAAHFVDIDDCLMTPGWAFLPSRLRPITTFHAFLGDAVYHVQPGAVPGVFVDGQPLGGSIRLRAGLHRMTFSEGAHIPANLAIYYTTPERERTTPPCRHGRVIMWYN